GHDFERLGIDQVSLRKNGDPALHRKQAANFKVLAGLGLDGFVSRHHQQHQVDAANSGQHIAHKTLVPGDIDQANADRLATWTLQVEVGETEVDGDAAALLFL